MKKRWTVFAMAVLLVLTTTACEMGQNWVFSLNGEELYNKDVDAFGFVYAMDHNITNEGQMDALYEDGDTYGEYYKKALEDDILSGVLLSREAEAAGIKLSKEQRQECKTKAEALLASFGESRLKEKNVEEQDVRKIYEMQKLGEIYVEGQVASKTGDSDTEGDRAGNEAEQYITVYQVMFPTVEFDENGMLVSNEDGTLKELSVTEKEEQKNRAEEFADKVSQGLAMEDVLKEYGTYGSGIRKNLKYNDLDEVYKKTVDGLSEGDTSHAFEGAYGYYVIELVCENAREHAEQIADHEEQLTSRNIKQDILKQLYDTYVGTDKNYRNDKQWEKVKIVDYLQ